MYPLKEEFTKAEVDFMKTYKFQSRNTPILYSLFIQKMFDYLHLYIPDYIMPNQLTLIGLISMIISGILTIYYNSCLTKKSKRLAFANLILLIIYFSADFVDGMHARRTNQCSPMGAVMDHGVDSFVISCVILTIFSSLRLGISKFILILSYISLFGFYLSGLHIKFAGYLNFSTISGPSEGLVSTMIVHLIACTKPEIIDSITAFFKRQNFYKHKNALCVYLSVILSGYWIYELVNSIFVEKGSIPTYYVSIALFETLLLLSPLYFFGFMDILLGFKNFNYFFVILAENFSVCYIEEAISYITNTSTDIRVFAFVYSLFFVFCVSFMFKNQYNIPKFCFFISSIHFILRVGSIFYYLSKGLNVKLFSKYL